MHKKKTEKAKKNKGNKKKTKLFTKVLSPNILETDLEEEKQKIPLKNLQRKMRLFT